MQKMENFALEFKYLLLGRTPTKRAGAVQRLRTDAHSAIRTQPIELLSLVPGRVSVRFD